MKWSYILLIVGGTFCVHLRKLTWNLKIVGLWMCFLFQEGAFSGSMLIILGGVSRSKIVLGNLRVLEHGIIDPSKLSGA